VEIPVHQLTEESQQSWKKNKLDGLKEAVRQVFAKHNIDQTQGYGKERYIQVLSILGRRGGNKTARLRRMKELIVKMPETAEQPSFPTSLFPGMQPKPVKRDRLGRRRPIFKPITS